jgi:YidC/Oxa1 family membrane protein insertase
VEILLKPFAWLLLFFYDVFHSYGLALILFAIVIKLILFPVTLKGKKSMIQTTMLSGKMQQLQKQYGKDRERYNLEVQKLYAREHVNPMGGCLWSMIPLVLLIALYAIIREPLTNLMDLSKEMVDQVANITGIANTGAYPQIAMAEALNNPATLEAVKTALGDAGSKVFAMDFTFLGINLADIPTWKFWEGGLKWEGIGLFLLPLVSTAVSFLSMKVSFATNKINNQTQSEQMDRTNRVMMFTMPLMSLWIGFTVPAGLSIYWIAQYFVTMAQEVICSRLLKKDYEAARAAAEERERQEKEEEKKRKEEARLERQRRLEEEKKNRGKKKLGQKKDEDSQQMGVNKDDSREGIRAYARGRAYIPNRFGEVTPYTDPNELFLAQAREQAAKKGKGKTKSVPESEKPVEEKPETEVETNALPQEVEQTMELPETPDLETTKKQVSEESISEEETSVQNDQDTEQNEEEKEV